MQNFFYIDGKTYKKYSEYRIALENSMFSNAYKPWTIEEENTLIRLYEVEKLNVGALSIFLKRRRGGIVARLNKVGLQSYEPDLTDLKVDYKEITNLLEKMNIKKLYHFTDRRNTNSILQHESLYSISELEKTNLKYFHPDYNKLVDYISLSFTEDHPMKFAAQREGRIKDPIILEIDINQMILEETLYSKYVANISETYLGSDYEYLIKYIDLKTLGSYTTKMNNPTTLDIRKSEILVYKTIGKENILNFNNLLRENFYG